MESKNRVKVFGAFLIFALTAAFLVVMVVYGDWGDKVPCKDCFSEGGPLVEGGDADLPPLPEKSSHLSKITEEEYKEIEPGPGKVDLKWDFSGDEVYAYDLDQSMKTSQMMGMGKNFSPTMKVKASGLLKFKSKGDHTADLVLQGLTMENNVDFGPEAPKSFGKQSQTVEMPTQVIQGVGEEGIVQFGQMGEQFNLRYLFPLPEAALARGESATVPISMPFNAMGSVLTAKGEMKIKLDKFVKIEDKTAALLDCDLIIDELDVPEEIEGEYEIKVKGRALYYFNVEERCFDSGKMAMMFSFRIDTPSPQMKMGDEDFSENFPKNIKMAADMDSFITLERDPAEER
jgi:hypothetical protein